MESSTVCIALFRRAIAESGTLSTQMANYVDGKQQERAMDDAAAVQQGQGISGGMLPFFIFRGQPPI
jgi:hypothetical protein